MVHLANLLSAACLALMAKGAPKNFDDWEHGRVALQDVSIHFRYAGSGPPLLLVHGNPQFSLTWQFIGPILAEHYTVIAPDNRGAGDSSIPPDGDYTSEASAGDLKGVLDFLNITSAYVFAHDKGGGMATALAIQHPSMVKRLVLAEYLFPGFGYEQASAPAPFWDLYGNPQLALFSIPDFAEFLINGKEKPFLQWYFYHGSYSGVTSFSEDTVNRYTTSISKPGFLRAMLGPFSTATVNADAQFFRSHLGQKPLEIPVLNIGGEASFGSEDILSLISSFVSKDLSVAVVPKAGHWLGDENPSWTANRVAKFFSEDKSPLQTVDLSSLTDRVTLQVGFFGTLRNAALGANIGM
ncbi:hydrolase, putative [Talaromyces stipitatus ATCC 10500]|uniref:Hydrolase, putative n=1 Tax=Talaromyces stipitatus (strain ATCC 10500 / CBS 375.48 / QM 6759 / NRRL 1006) TaxID=441959 RepID=B8M0H5_TALSN|nr:hydrolase, putative [Talaromyces stipitatus ATCC 10500]EED21272.1 hydrolase, putative [Talaromyces stipitatus ATCC 10500]